MTSWASDGVTVIKDHVLRCPTSAGGALHRRVYGYLIDAPATPTTDSAQVGGIEDSDRTSVATTRAAAGSYSTYPSQREYEPDEAGGNILLQAYGAAETLGAYVYESDMVSDNVIGSRVWSRGVGLADPTKLALLAFGSRHVIWKDQRSTTHEGLFNRCLALQEDAAGDGKVHIAAGTIQYASATESVLYNGAGVSSVSRTGAGLYDITLSTVSTEGTYPLVFATAWNNAASAATDVCLCSVRFAAGTLDMFTVCVFDAAGTAKDPDCISVIAIIAATSPWSSEALTAANLGRLISVGSGETAGCALSFGAVDSNGGATSGSFDTSNLAATAGHAGGSGVYGMTCTDAYDDSNILWFVTPVRIGAAPGVDCATTVVSANTDGTACEWYAWDISGGGAWPDTASTHFCVLGIGV